VRVCGWGAEVEPDPTSPDVDRDPPADGIALVAPPSDVGSTEVLVGAASAVWSFVAISPTSAPPTAMLSPAATTRPCVLSVRLAIVRVSHRRVRNG
jgi:hypothetical protein